MQALRAARGLSLAQIQQETRIPVDVLRRFEDGELIGDRTYNEVYLKAFLKSYAKAVGASSSEVITAYQAQQSGSYQGGLHPDHRPSTDDPPAVQGGEPAAPPAPAPVKAAPAAPATVPEPVAGVRERPSAPAPSGPATVPSSRVSRPAVPGARRSYDKNWRMIIGLFVGAVAVLAAVLYFLVFDGSGDPEGEVVATEASSEVAGIDSSGVETPIGESGKRLQIPIRVTVTAGGNGLQNFRVTETPSERLGHWIEPGNTMTFESDSLVVLWGEGAEGVGPEATIEIQGERWTPASGRVIRIDRQNGQRLLDSLATAPSAATDPPAATADGA